jgi:hypothetical protein
MVVGDKPDEIMAKYDMSLKVKPYVKFRYKDAAKIKESTARVYANIIKDSKKFMLNEFQEGYIQEQLKAINNLSPFEYYRTITNGLYYDENGDALSEENPIGKWKSYAIGEHFSMPLILKDGKEVYQAINKDVDWETMINKDRKIYEDAWDLVHNVRDPETDEERMIYDNMKERTKYFSRFKDKESYATYNSAYWNYAFVDKNKWVGLDDDNKELDWIENFYDRFVKNVQPEEKITIFECTR